MKMEIKPLKKRVLIAENNTERKTESGIVLDGIKSMKETPIATVLAIGPEVTLVNVGDVILPDWSKASVVKVANAQRAMIDEEHIIAVVD
jgi:co-chaperonin GroES (HSP10)